MSKLYLSILFILLAISVPGQNSSYDDIWTSAINHANVSTSILVKNCPHFPLKSGKAVDVTGWIAAFPNEVEQFFNYCESNGFNFSRIQLGVKEKPINIGSIVPHWPNAINAFGASEIAKELPHMPDPNDYCDVAGYLKDNKKFNKWRDDIGYGPGTNEKVEAASKNAPHPNDLFNETIYPCLAKYYSAIDRWIYDYAKEYHKLMDACNCGDDKTVWSEIPVMPDSLKQPYIPPMERFSIQMEDNSNTESDEGDETDNEQK